MQLIWEVTDKRAYKKSITAYEQNVLESNCFQQYIACLLMWSNQILSYNSKCIKISDVQYLYIWLFMHDFNLTDIVKNKAMLCLSFLSLKWLSLQLWTFFKKTSF